MPPRKKAEAASAKAPAKTQKLCEHGAPASDEISAVASAVETAVVTLLRKEPFHAPLPRIATLRHLRVPRALSPQQRDALSQCRQITFLGAQGCSGSLAFLEDWSALETLDLQDSGDLTDLEVLLPLPKLCLIRLNGAKMKRESWPAALQERMTYRD
jgi:hypothetical protein